MSQLVGSRCGLCHETVGSVLEGEFCSVCGSAYHHGCRRPEAAPAGPSWCAACGADISALLAARAAHERAAVAAKERGPVTRVYTAIACLEVIAVILFGGGAYAYFGVHKLDPELALTFGGFLLGLVAFIQAVAFGLYRGQSWGRLASIALLVLSVPSVALPVSVLGLIMLGDSKRWAEYAAKRRATKA